MKIYRQSLTELTALISLAEKGFFFLVKIL